VPTGSPCGLEVIIPAVANAKADRAAETSAQFSEFEGHPPPPFSSTKKSPVQHAADDEVFILPDY
jgi:hypothetical protein